MSPGQVVIVGAGPCGLACARELLRAGRDEVVVLEHRSGPGGLASSVVDAAGFTWDRGGHVVFSHFGEFDRLLSEVMGEDVERHERSSYVHMYGDWVPYPLQNNLHRLRPDVAVEALVGLVAAQHRTAEDPSVDAGDELDFGTWLESEFGAGIVRHFMRPYNEKVWAQPLSSMSSQWMAERVASVDWRQAVKSVVHREDDVAWGPNNMFSFPAVGGTGEIYRRAAAAVGDHVQYGAAVVAVDPDRCTVLTADGDEFPYEHLVWTGALDRLVEVLVSPPNELRAAVGQLVHNSVTVVGIGYEAPLCDERSWLYFPHDDVPFYRATNFAKYAAANVPGGRTDRYSSWMTEIASSPWRPLDETDLVGRVDAALRSLHLVPESAPVASGHIDHLPYGYPVPTLGRDAALRTIQPWLMDRSILSRGRFGAWLYELGNMDHAVKMGVDAARWIVDGRPEEAWSL